MGIAPNTNRTNRTTTHLFQQNEPNRTRTVQQTEPEPNRTVRLIEPEPNTMLSERRARMCQKTLEKLMFLMYSM